MTADLQPAASKRSRGESADRKSVYSNEESTFKFCAIVLDLLFPAVSFASVDLLKTRSCWHQLTQNYFHAMNSELRETLTAGGFDVQSEVIAAEHGNQPGHEHADDGCDFDIGDVVDVMPRLWSGINKPGGAARITAVTYDEDEEEHTYTVKYILGGVEKDVSGVYITSANLEGKKHRGTIGRCRYRSFIYRKITRNSHYLFPLSSYTRWCKSFIRDCEHDQDNDPFFQPMPISRHNNHQPLVPLLSDDYEATRSSATHQTSKKRKYREETAEQRQERKHIKEQKLLQMQQERREALQAHEAEQERQHLSNKQTMLLPDDETTLDGTGADAYDSMDLDEDEDWVPSDTEMATALQGRVGRVVQDSSDEEDVRANGAGKSAEKSLSIRKFQQSFTDVSTLNKATGSTRMSMGLLAMPQSAQNSTSLGPASVQHISAVDTRHATLPPARSASILSVANNSTSPLISTYACAAPVPISATETSATLAQVAHVNANKTTNVSKVLPHTFSAPRLRASMSAAEIAHSLHERILDSCVGSAAFDFINNSRNAVNDRTAAAVNQTFNELIATIRTLNDDEQIALYHVTFDWFESLYRENMFDASLDAIEGRQKALRDGQTAELSRLQKDLDVLDEEMEATLQRLARAGFDVFTKLAKVKDKQVRRLKKRVDIYNGLVSGTRVSARKRLERLRLRLQETSELWGCVDSESDSDSGGESDRDISKSRGGVYNSHIPNMPASRMVKGIPTTSFSRSHSNNSHNLSRSSTGSGGGRREDRAVKRLRSGEKPSSAHNDDSNDYSVDYGVQDDDGINFTTGTAQQQARGEKHNSTSRAASNVKVSANTKLSYSARVRNEMAFIFEGTKARSKRGDTLRGAGRGTVGRTSSGQNLSSAEDERKAESDRTAFEKFVPLYRRAPAPSVLDLPRYIRYHGRVTVLEGPLMGTVPVPVPVQIERSPSYLLASASAAWNGDNRTYLEDAVGAENTFVSNSSHNALPLPDVATQPSGRSRLPETNYPVPLSSAPSQTSFQQSSALASLDSLDESLIDVVLSSMVNPFALEPPLHLRRQFYQLSSHFNHAKAADQAAEEVWAEQFVNHLAAKASHSPKSGDEASATEGFVRGLSLATTSAVQSLLQRLALYEEASARSSQLHPSHTPRILEAGFNEKAAFAQIVSLTAEKLCRLSVLYDSVAARLFLCPAAGSLNSIERISNVKWLAQNFDRLAKVTFSRITNGRGKECVDDPNETEESLLLHAAGSVVAQDLSKFLRLSTIEDSKSDDLVAYIVLSLLRMKVILVRNCAMHTLETAKTRPLTDQNDAMSVLDRIEEEVADWDVMNFCFSALLVEQQEVINAMLANERLTLAVLHYLSEIPPTDREGTDFASEDGGSSGFEKGIGGVAKLTAGLLFEILSSLRTLHVAINTARASSSASAHGTRVWACYDASREQANGVIATYPKHVWRGVVLAIYAHIARSPNSSGGTVTAETVAFFDEKQWMPAMVNPVVLRQHHKGSPSTDDSDAFAYLSGKDSLWAIMTIFTHLLRTVKVKENANANQSLTISPSNRGSSRVDCAWSLLKGLAQATLESALRSAPTSSCASVVDLMTSASEVDAGAFSQGNPSDASGADCLTQLVRRIGHFAALWTDSSSEATVLTISLLHRASSHIGSLFPLFSTVSTAVDTRGAAKSAGISGPPALEPKSVLFLCFYTFFDCRQPSRKINTGEVETRRTFTKQLKFLVAMLYETFKLPNNVFVSAQHQSINAALDSGNKHRELTQSSLQALDAVRDAFKAMLYNSYTEACSSQDGAAIVANLTAIRAAANKLPRSHQKLRILALLDDNNGPGGGNLQAGTLLLSLLAEMISFFGEETVRQKLKLAPTQGAVALPLQQQVMEILSHTLMTAAHGTSASSTGATGSTIGSETGAGSGTLLAEVDSLLQRVPLHQQHQQQSQSLRGDERRGAIGNTVNVSAPQLDSSAVNLCLQWQAGLVTFPPLSVDAAQFSVHTETSPGKVLDADLRRIVESQRSQSVYFEPVLHLLRQSVQLQQTSSQLVNVFGAKAFVESSLGASLAVCATIMGNIDAIIAPRCTISLDTQSLHSTDVMTAPYRLVLLQAPLLSEMLKVMHACMPSAASVVSKDGLSHSAVYVLSQFILYLQNWHHGSRQLLSAAQAALNIDATARVYLEATLKEEDDLFCRLLNEALRLRAATVVSSYKSSNVGSKTSPSELVTCFLTHLSSLVSSINKTDITVLDPTALLKASSDDTLMVETARKMRMHKVNTAPGGCFAICQALGTLVSLIAGISNVSAPSSALLGSGPQRSGLAAAVVAEVTDNLEKIDQAATAAGVNALLGNWLKVVFWLPILQTAALETTDGDVNSGTLSLVCAHFPDVVCAWVGCAALGEATTTSHRILQQIDFSTFHRTLVQLATVLMRNLRIKTSAGSASTLTNADVQCLRLAETLTQVASVQLSANTSNASAFVVKFLRLFSTGRASSVLASLMVCSSSSSGVGGGGGPSYSFPAMHRASLEATNVQLSRELLKCLQVMKLEIFRSGENHQLDSPEAKRKEALEISSAKLKGLFGEIAYLYRVLVDCEVPCAEFNTGHNGTVGNDAAYVRFSARFLRSLQSFPRMVTLDLAFSFLGDIVEQDAIAAIGLMFRHAARGEQASPGLHSALKKDLHRNFLCNVPKYLLLASDTPYSTRQTAWRSVLAPMLLTPAYTATGAHLARQLAASKSATHATNSPLPPFPMLTENNIGEEAYFTLLVCALTLALPVPEQLALLGPSTCRTGDQSLGTQFVELLSTRLRLPVKQATLWALYSQLVEIVKNTSMGSFSVESSGDANAAGDRSLRQDSQLTRFRQYLLLGGAGAQTSAASAGGESGSGPNKLGATLTGQPNLLWEQISAKAREVLRMKIAEDQQRLSLQKGASFQPASAAMFVLPWAAVRACLHLHTCALEDVLESLISTQRDPQPSPVGVPFVPNVFSEREEVLSLVVTSTVYALRGAVSLCEMQHQVTASYPLITETGKQLLQSLLQYCALATESVASSWSHLQMMVRGNVSRSTGAADAFEEIIPEVEVLRLWTACVRQLREVLKLDVTIQSDLIMFVLCCWQLLRCFYQLAICNNVLIVESFLTSAVTSPGTAQNLPPAPQLICAASQCACPLCHGTSGATTSSGGWDGAENVSCVGTLQMAVIQLHRDLVRTHRPSGSSLTAQQGAHLRDLLGTKLDGIAEVLGRVTKGHST